MLAGIAARSRQRAVSAGYYPAKRTKHTFALLREAVNELIKFKAYGKSTNDVRNCVHIGTLGKLLFSNDEGDRESVCTPCGE